MILHFFFESPITADELPRLDRDRQLAPGLPGRTRESIATAMCKVTQAEGNIASRAALDADFNRFRFWRWLTAAEPNEKIGRNNEFSAATLPSETNC